MPFTKGHKINVGKSWSEARRLEHKKLMKQIMGKDEIRLKISDGRKGINFSDAHKRNLSTALLGHKGYWAGKKRDEPWNQKEKHPNWRGGSSFEPYPLGWTKTFKEQIRYRDGYKCQLCGCPEIECVGKLNVHHVDYDKHNLDPSNLISLCKSCHGKTNKNRKYWQQFFEKGKE